MTLADTVSQGQCKQFNASVLRFECSVVSRAFDIVYRAAQQIWVLDFSNGSQADVRRPNIDVRFTPKSGHRNYFR